MIGGNVTALLQVKDEGTFNAIGEREHTWSDVTALKGWIDLQTGESNRVDHDAKIQKSTHIFLCDFTSLTDLSTEWVWDPFSFLTGIISKGSKKTVDVTSDNASMVVNGLVYEILLIDNPMNLNQHLEIYLQYVGGQNV